MDYQVHRWRFSNWVPCQIKSLAADFFSTLVAVGREDGEIEVCDPSNKFVVRAKLSGCNDFMLQSLKWSNIAEQKGRLFGISLRGFLFEVNLTSAQLVNICDSYGGAAWCLDVCPREASMTVGCEDGSAKCFSYEDARITYKRTYASVGSRILSISYHPVKTQIYFGCADGTIRCVDEISGKGIFCLTGDVLRGSPTLVWSLKVLSDSTVVSGDNRGNLHFFDGEHGVRFASFQQHTADIYAIACSADENIIFASGVDSKVTCLRRVNSRQSSSPSSSFSPSSSQWVYTSAHRPHSHDVFTLALCKVCLTSATSLNEFEYRLLSGGLDAKLCSYSVVDFDKFRPSWVLPVPTVGLIQANSSCTTMLMRHRNSLDLWNLAPLKNSASKDEDDNDQIELKASKKGNKKMKKVNLESVSHADEEICNSRDRCQLVLKIGLKDTEHINCSALSQDGNLVAASSASGMRLWMVNREFEAKRTGSSRSNKTETCSVTKLTLPRQAAQFSHAMAFSADGCRFATATRNGLALLDVAGVQHDKKKGTQGHPAADFSSSVELRHFFDHNSSVAEAVVALQLSPGSASSALEFVVKGLSFSSDGQWLAAASAGHVVYIYELDRFCLHWTLPRCAAPVTAAAFHPRFSSLLVVLLANNTFLAFDVDKMRLAQWSLDNTDAIPLALRSLPGPVEGISFDIDSRRASPADCAFFLHGQGFSVFVDFAMKVPEKPRIIAATDTHSVSIHVATDLLLGPTIGVAKVEDKLEHKRYKKSSSVDCGPNFTVIHAYRSLVYLACLENRQLV